MGISRLPGLDFKKTFDRLLLARERGFLRAERYRCGDPVRPHQPQVKERRFLGLFRRGPASSDGLLLALAEKCSPVQPRLVTCPYILNIYCARERQNVRMGEARRPTASTATCSTRRQPSRAFHGPHAEDTQVREAPFRNAEKKTRAKENLHSRRRTRSLRSVPAVGISIFFSLFGGRQSLNVSAGGHAIRCRSRKGRRPSPRCEPAQAWGALAGGRPTKAPC